VHFFLKKMHLRCIFFDHKSKFFAQHTFFLHVEAFFLLAEAFFLHVEAFFLLADAFFLLGFTFLTPGFTFLTTGFTFLTPWFTFLTPRFTFLTPRFTFLTPGFTFWTPGFTFWTPGFTFLTQTPKKGVRFSTFLKNTNVWKTDFEPFFRSQLRLVTREIGVLNWYPDTILEENLIWAEQPMNARTPPPPGSFYMLHLSVVSVFWSNMRYLRCRRDRGKPDLRPTSVTFGSNGGPKPDPPGGGEFKKAQKVCFFLYSHETCRLFWGRASKNAPVVGHP